MQTKFDKTDKIFIQEKQKQGHSKKISYKKVSNWAVRFASGKYINQCSSNNFILKVNPQAVVKISGFARSGAGLTKMLKYIARIDKEKELELETELGEAVKGKKEIDNIIKDWKEDFKERKNSEKVKTRHATHLILSGKAKNTEKNQQKVFLAAKETAKKMFEGYKYTIGIHQDGTYPHTHIIVNNYGTEKKLRIDPENIFEIRKTFAEELTNQGLKHSATLTKDRLKFLNKIKKEKLNKINQNYFVNLVQKNTKDKNLFNHKKIILSYVVKERNKINNQHIKKEEKLKKLSSLRNIERGLIQKKKIQEYKKILEDKNLFFPDITKKKLLHDKDKAVKFMYGKLKRDINNAKDYINIANLSLEKKQIALKNLSFYTKNIEKSLNVPKPRRINKNIFIAKNKKIVSKKEKDSLNITTKKVKFSEKNLEKNKQVQKPKITRVERLRMRRSKGKLLEK